MRCSVCPCPHLGAVPYTCDSRDRTASWQVLQRTSPPLGRPQRWSCACGHHRHASRDPDRAVWLMRCRCIRRGKNTLSSRAAHCAELWTDWFHCNRVHQRECSSKSACWPAVWPGPAHTGQARTPDRTYRGREGCSVCFQIDVRCSDRNRIISNRSILIAQVDLPTYEGSLSQYRLHLQ